MERLFSTRTPRSLVVPALTPAGFIRPTQSAYASPYTITRDEIPNLK